MTDSLTAEPEKDGFKQESPIRAFTDFQVSGLYAIGKGFRPSLQHLPTYLGAMAEKEGWALVQIIEANAPTIIFRRMTLHERYQSTHMEMVIARIPSEDEINYAGLTPAEQASGEVSLKRFIGKSPALGMPYGDSVDFEVDDTIPWNRSGSDTPIPAANEPAALAMLANLLGAPHLPSEYRKLFPSILVPPSRYDTLYKRVAHALPDRPALQIKKAIDNFRVANSGGKGAIDPYKEASAKVLAEGTEVTSDDPVNPKHYAGTDCADIGERLSANGYQILKYVWRLGKKDDPCVEIGKAIWYANREKLLLRSLGGGTIFNPNKRGLKPENYMTFLINRIHAQPQFTQNIALMLWNGYTERRMIATIETLKEHKFHLECGRGLAI